jgi:hypothetical protein
MSSSLLLEIDLWMKGCYRWAAPKATEKFFRQRLQAFDSPYASLQDELRECVCTVLGGANAYLDQYCQLERIYAGKSPDGIKEPQLIGFCYNQGMRKRRYEMFLLRAERASDAVLHVWLQPLPGDFDVVLEDDGNGPKSVRAAFGGRAARAIRVQRDDQMHIKRLADFRKALRSAIRRWKSPARAWLSLVDSSEHRDFVSHVPRSVADRIRSSIAVAEAIDVLDEYTSHPADAPVLMSPIYEDLKRLPEIKSRFEDFQSAIARHKSWLTTTADVQAAKKGLVKPATQLFGRVTAVSPDEEQDGVYVEFWTPESPFTRVFDLQTLKAKNAAFRGAGVSFTTFELQGGVWSSLEKLEKATSSSFSW